MGPDLQYGDIEKPSGESPPLSWKTGRRDFSDINGLPIVKSTLENSLSSESQKPIQTEVIYLYSLKDPWEQTFSPNSLDCTTFQGFKNWSSASNAKYYIFSLRLCRVFLRKMLFLGSIKVASDTQLDVLPLSLSVVLTALMLKINILSYFVSILVSLCSHK